VPAALSHTSLTLHASAGSLARTLGLTSRPAPLRTTQNNVSSSGDALLSAAPFRGRCARRSITMAAYHRLGSLGCCICRVLLSAQRICNTAHLRTPTVTDLLVAELAQSMADRRRVRFCSPRSIHRDCTKPRSNSRTYILAIVNGDNEYYGGSIRDYCSGRRARTSVLVLWCAKESFNGAQPSEGFACGYWLMRCTQVHLVLSQVRPNPSLKLTRYGRRCKPGPRHMVHHREPGLQRPPTRAA